MKRKGQDFHAVASHPECNSADVLWQLSVCTVGPVSYVIISSCNSPKAELSLIYLGTRHEIWLQSVKGTD